MIQDELTLHDFYTIDAKVEEVARALGLLDLGLDRDVTDLSGGQRDVYKRQIIGRTGSGKSTLIQHFNGLFQPKSGDYFFNGENIWEKKYDLKKLRQKVALLSLIHI